MAREVTVRLLDDLDRSLTADETVQFTLDGTSYEMDLNEKNATKLRKALEPFIDNARKAGKAGRAARSHSGGRPMPREDLDAIRAWAKAKGKTISDRGRVAMAIQNEYDAEQTSKTTPAKKTAVTKNAVNTDERSPSFSG